MRLWLPALTLFLAHNTWAGGKLSGPVEIPAVNLGVGAAPIAGAVSLPQTAPQTTSTLGLPSALPVARPVGLARRMANALVAKVQSLAGVGENVPSWPGKEGDRVRLGKTSWTLAKIAGEGGGSTVWDALHRDQVVKILHPELAELPHYGDEAELLKALKHSDIPHARLIASSKDGRVMVKEKIEGDKLSVMLARGFEDRHREGWSELAAKLIRSGVTADFAQGNVAWSRWRGSWIFYDAGGIRDAGPESVLRQMLTPEAKAAGLHAAAFLRGLRGRLGPSSTSWTKTENALRSSPEFADDFAALQAADRALPAAPRLGFESSREPGPFPDRVVSTSKEVRKAVGYDPQTIKPRWALHGDDPGKLNTRVYRVEPPGKAKAVVKETSWEIVRHELAMRRVVRRFFSRWFDVPSAFAVNNGMDSWLLMEHKEGGPAYGTEPMTLEQRVAMAILMNAFGVWDVNPGNILYATGGRPVLIDFEQALSRRSPVASRAPDERIALEMPWMSRTSLNRIEDYQPAIRAWREFFAKTDTQDAIRAELVLGGFSEPEAAQLLRLIAANTADLDWTLQNDAEFVNHFVNRRRG